jgi:hypothetical protein
MYMEKLTQFMLFMRGLRIQKNYEMNDMLAMDETPTGIWLNMPNSVTAEAVGVKSVPVRTTGHEKAQVTLCLTAKADGT